MGANQKVIKATGYRRVMGWVFVAVIFIYMGKMLRENWVQVREADFALEVLPLLFSTLIFAFSYVVQMWIWYLITCKLGIALPARDTATSWVYSQFGKYLPGKVWLVLGRLLFYASKGKSKKIVSVGLYLETISMIAAAALVFLISLFFFAEVRFPLGRSPWGWVSLFIVGIFMLLHPGLLQKVLNGFLIRFKREPVTLPLRYRDILWIVFLSVLAWGIGGVGFYLFVDAVFPVSPDHILFLTGALAFSSTLGLLAIFSPSGLGVREGILVYLLSHTMPGAVAVLVSILTRIWMTLIEIGLAGMIYLVCLVRERNGKGKAHG